LFSRGLEKTKFYTKTARSLRKFS